MAERCPSASFQKFTNQKKVWKGDTHPDQQFWPYIRKLCSVTCCFSENNINLAGVDGNRHSFAFSLKFGFMLMKLCWFPNIHGFSLSVKSCFTNCDCLTFLLFASWKQQQEILITDGPLPIIVDMNMAA